MHVKTYSMCIRKSAIACTTYFERGEATGDTFTAIPKEVPGHHDPLEVSKYSRRTHRLGVGSRTQLAGAAFYRPDQICPEDQDAMVRSFTKSSAGIAYCRFQLIFNGRLPVWDIYVPGPRYLYGMVTPFSFSVR